jgi:hypothetical protein
MSLSYANVALLAEDGMEPELELWRLLCEADVSLLAGADIGMSRNMKRTMLFECSHKDRQWLSLPYPQSLFSYHDRDIELTRKLCLLRTCRSICKPSRWCCFRVSRTACRVATKRCFSLGMAGPGLSRSLHHKVATKTHVHMQDNF